MKHFFRKIILSCCRKTGCYNLLRSLYRLFRSVLYKVINILGGCIARIRGFVQKLRVTFFERSMRKAVEKGIKSAPSPKPVDYVAVDLSKPYPSQAGAYVRLDYWAPITSGGSYGHTCFVAKELNKLTPGLQCAMAHKYSLLDSMRVSQTKFPAAMPCSSNAQLIIQGQRYEKPLLQWLRKVKPSFIYERLCLGTIAGARAAQELNIPFIAEYNGSEIEMRHSYGDSDMTHLGILSDIEDWALKQATVISVVSEQIKCSLIERGFDPARICVNPNGVDTEEYCPLPEQEKLALKKELGFAEDDIVLCFIGTFGGWHGVEVLAEVLPEVLETVPKAKFLLIGDGPFKHLIDDIIQRHNLQEKVVCTGRVPQLQGRRLLQAGDIYLSPHSGHMKNMPFFGSPTKLFEYMALGGAIIASDLEQIGQVLRPAFFAKDIETGKLNALPEDERAILCTPGDVDEFASACIYAAQNVAFSKKLGQNARAAAKEFFTWEKHVERLWSFAAGNKKASWESAHFVANLEQYNQQQYSSEGKDRARSEAQKQWNTNPCGAVEGLENLDLKYFLRVEENRYQLEGYIPKVFPFDQFAGKKVLEIGCGHGTDSAQFAKNGAFCHVVDITDRHLELTRRNFEVRGYPLEHKKCDATAIDYPDAYFDCVYSYGVIHHIPDVEKVLKEVKRVLKPEGTLCLAVYNKYSVFHILQKIFIEGILEQKFISLGYKGILATIEYGADGINIRPYVKLYGKTEFASLLRKSGFHIDKIGVDCLHGIHFNRWHKRFWPKWKRYENSLGWYVYAVAKNK